MATTPIEPGDKIPLNERQREALGRQLIDLTTDLERQHMRYIADIGVHWDWYSAKPDVPRRSEPWPGASNIVVPFIRQQADAQIARHLLTLFSSKNLWALSTENEFFADRLAEISRFLNSSAEVPFDSFDPLEAAISEQIVVGEAVLAQRWAVRQRFLVAPGEKRPRLVTFGAGPEYYHRPREQWLWFRGMAIEDSPVVVEQSFTTEGELIRHTQVGDERSRWSRSAVEQVLGETGIEGPVEDVRRRKLEQLGLDPNLISRNLEPHDIRQATLDWPFFENLDRPRLSDVPTINSVMGQEVSDISVPAVVIFHRRTGEILRANYSPYLFPGNPFRSIHFRKLSGVNQGSHGVAKIGEHVQRALTTLLNQSIDAVTLANSIKVVTSDRQLGNRPWSPNTIPVVEDVDAIKELTGQKQIFPDIALMQGVQAIGERTLGQGDPNLGRETRLGGHPQPATNFLGLLQQSQIISSRSVRSLRRGIGFTGSDRAMMFQQFETNRAGWIETRFGPVDALKITQWLESGIPAAGNVRFDVHSLSEIHSPDAERQKAVLVDQMVTNYYIQVAKFLEVAKNPQADPDLRRLMLTGIVARGKSMARFLENSDVDDVEAYLFELQSQNERSTNGIRELSSLVDQRLGGGSPGQSPGAVEGSPGVGNLVALTGGGGGGAG